MAYSRKDILQTACDLIMEKKDKALEYIEEKKKKACNMEKKKWEEDFDFWLEVQLMVKEIFSQEV